MPRGLSPRGAGGGGVRTSATLKSKDGKKQSQKQANLA